MLGPNAGTFNKNVSTVTAAGVMTTKHLKTGVQLTPKRRVYKTGLTVCNKRNISLGAKHCHETQENPSEVTYISAQKR
jgi:hypothetical protein